MMGLEIIRILGKCFVTSWLIMCMGTMIEMYVPFDSLSLKVVVY